MPVGILGIVTAVEWLSVSGSEITVAQLLGPGDIANLEPPVRAAVSVIAIFVAGGALLRFKPDFVEHSIDSWLEQPGIAVLYGLMAYGLVLFVLTYVSTQLIRFGTGTQIVGFAVGGAGGAALLTLSGLGFTIVGAGITDIQGVRQPGIGLVIGAGISGIVWLALPVLPGLGAWIIVAAIGLGGPTRVWFHSDRPTVSD